MNHYLRDTPYPYQAIIAIIIFFSTTIIAYNRSIRKEKHNLGLVWALCLLYCLYSYCDGDYYHYKEIFIDHRKGYEVWSIEPVYVWILDYTPFYECFRIAIWGSGLYFLYLSAKKINIWSDKFIYFFVIFNLLLYSYARVSLAMSMAVYGFVLLINEKKIYYKVWGIILLIGSFFFHKSAIIVLLLIPFTFIPWGKKSIIFCLLCLPIGAYFVNTYAIDYILNANLSEAQSNAVTGYIINGNYNEERGVARILLDIIVQVPAYIGIYIMLKKGQSRELPIVYHYLFRWTALICLLATVFIAFPFSRVLYYRLMFIARIPEIFTLMIIIKRNNVSNKYFWLRLFIIMCLCYDIMKLSYSFYLSFVQ